MLAPTDALPSALERAGEIDKREVGRDAFPACGLREVDIGSVTVANVWLALYVIAAVIS
jgi:hypothetical protein